jgi:drug/metabolite transporter (DMT)-like permease
MPVTSSAVVEPGELEALVAYQARLLKTHVMTVIVVLTQVFGDYFLSRGLKQVGSLLGRPPIAFIVAFANPWVALGVSLLILWLLSHMVLLSWADLSYVLPVTSIGYVLVALAGRFFLQESVSWMRWSGILLIVLGVILVGRTAPSTSQVPNKVIAETRV